MGTQPHSFLKLLLHSIYHDIFFLVHEQRNVFFYLYHSVNIHAILLILKNNSLAKKSVGGNMNSFPILYSVSVILINGYIFLWDSVSSSVISPSSQSLWFHYSNCFLLDIFKKDDSVAVIFILGRVPTYVKSFTF